MNQNSMARLSPKVKEEIKRHKIFPGESYDQVLQRLFGLRRIPKQFKFKGLNDGK